MQLDLSTHQRDEYRQRGPEDEESADHEDDVKIWEEFINASH